MTPGSDGDRLQLLVGFTASNPDSSKALLEDLVRFAEGFEELAEIVVCDNCENPDRIVELLKAFEERGVRTRLPSKEEIKRSASGGSLGAYYVPEENQAGIAFGRTALHHFLYVESKGFDNPVVWILDDDVRLDEAFFSDQKDFGKEKPFRAVLHKFMSEGVSVAVGRIAGDPPVPGASMIRTQMLDLDFNLRALCNPDFSPDDKAIRLHLDENEGQFPDFYYDLSMRHYGHIETPWWYAERDADRLRTLDCLLAKVPLIGTGVNVFRPLPSVFSDGYEEGEATPTRGGNTLVFDMGCLKDYPNIAPKLGDVTLRRGDTLWAILNKHVGAGGRGRKVVGAEFSVRQDRRFCRDQIFNLQTLLCDIMGSAFTRAVDETLRGRTRASTAIAFSQEEVSKILATFEKHLQERLLMLQFNSWRIQGLVCSIRAQVRAVSSRGGQEANVLRARGAALESLLQSSAQAFSPEAIGGLRRAALSTSMDQLERFLLDLDGHCESYRGRFSVADAPSDIARVTSTLRRRFGERDFRFLAEGKEGVVVTDGARAYKFFRSGLKTFREGQLRFLQERLTSAAIGDAGGILPLEEVAVDGEDVVFVTRLVRGRTYAGGLLKQMTGLVKGCKKAGIAITNLSPENLVVTDDARLVYVDLGRSIEPLSEENYREMCKRAFLVYRWHFRRDLKALLRSSLRDESLPELFGLEWFLAALEDKAVHEMTDASLLAAVRETKPRHILDYGCGDGKTADELAAGGVRVTAYDVDPSSYARRTHPRNVRFVDGGEMRRLLDSGRKFGLVLCNQVVCTIRDPSAVERVLSDLRRLVDDRGTVVLGLCNPFDLETQESESQVKRTGGEARYRTHFSYSKYIKASRRRRTEFHRPLSWYTMMLRRAGMDVGDVREVPSTDILRLCPGSDLLILHLKPLKLPRAPKVSLLIKASAMEWRTIRKQVTHIVEQLEGPGSFLERVVVIDGHEGPFSRQYDAGNLPALKEELALMVSQKVIDRVVVSPDDPGTLAALARKWFALDVPAARCENGQPTLTTLHGMERCAGEYVLHADSDCLIGRLDRKHDYLADMVAVFERDPRAVTVSMPIAARSSAEFTARNGVKNWRVEARCGLVSKSRLHRLLPLRNGVTEGGLLALPWHRALDERLAESGYNSYRGGNPATFFVHVPNDRKSDVNSWYNVMMAVEDGRLHDGQLGRVELVGGAEDWLPKRSESSVLVVRGRDVPASKLRRCFDSLARQTDQDWGLLVVDAGSDNGMEEYVDTVVRMRYGSRFTFYRNLRPETPVANIYFAIRRLCDNEKSMIAMPDADDAFVCDDAIAYLKSVYSQGADLAVGGLMRTDKEAWYPADFREPRRNRGGNVWQPLRTFRKHLFDAMRVEDLRVDGEWVPHTEDWAFMLPIAELARSPVQLARTIYLYEPSPLKQALPKQERERLIEKLVGKRPLRRP